jgi:hypothetical protein
MGPEVTSGIAQPSQTARTPHLVNRVLPRTPYRQGDHRGADARPRGWRLHEISTNDRPGLLDGRATAARASGFFGEGGSCMTLSRSLVPVGLALLGPVAVGGILAVQSGDPSPLAIVPAITFGVAGVTSPALYIATTATGSATPLAQVGRALVAALGAFGLALGGVLLPAAFLAWSSRAPITTSVVTSGALAIAAVFAVRRLASELDRGKTRTTARLVVFACWSIATLGIAGRLWWTLVGEVMS